MLEICGGNECLPRAIDKCSKKQEEEKKENGLQLKIKRPNFYKNSIDTFSKRPKRLRGTLLRIYNSINLSCQATTSAKNSIFLDI